MQSFVQALAEFSLIDLLVNIFNFIVQNPILKGLSIVVILIILIKLFKQIWLFHRQAMYKDAIKWTVLELKIPREVGRTPKAMEQFFMNLHSLRNAPTDLLEKYIDGEVTMWWSLEIVSFGGEIHFYIRSPQKHAKMTAAAVYAQYPHAEVFEVEDYLNELPDNTYKFYQKNLDIFGSEFVLRKPSFYPITTYRDFELTKEEMAIDPISALVEVLANIHKQETVAVQILIRPAGPDWREEGAKIVNKLVGRKEETKKSGGGGGLAEFLSNFILAPAEYPKWTDKPKEEKAITELWTKIQALTPGEKRVVEAIENKISKPGFESLIRYLYVSPVSVFSTNFARRGLLGGFNQYATQDLNAFRSNYNVETRSRWVYFPHLFVKKRVEGRKQRLLDNFRRRRLPEELYLGEIFTSHPLNFNFASFTYILTSDELATLFHVPPEVVLTGPHIKRAESKRMGPPAGLPIFTGD